MNIRRKMEASVRSIAYHTRYPLVLDRGIPSKEFQM